MADSSSGVTPLEAAARALHREMGCKDDGTCVTCTIRVRAALSAAIEALPRNPKAPDAIWLRSTDASVAYVVSAELLRRAFGLGDQEP